MAKALRYSEEEADQMVRRIRTARNGVAMPKPIVPLERLLRESGISPRTRESASRSKFRNKKTVIDGITFDSIAEGSRYVELRQMLARNEIAQLETQPVYPLVVDGILVAKYIADFRYKRGDAMVVEDVKGFKTREYQIKKKLMKACFGIDVIEIKVGGRRK